MAKFVVPYAGCCFNRCWLLFLPLWVHAQALWVMVYLNLLHILILSIYFNIIQFAFFGQTFFNTDDNFLLNLGIKIYGIILSLKNLAFIKICMLKCL